MSFNPLDPAGKYAQPPAPDYIGAANAQGGISKDIANQQTWANRPNQVGPWGSLKWRAKESIDPATGKPVTSWTQKQTLNPKLQRALQSQLALQTGRSKFAGNMMGDVRRDLKNPMSYEGLAEAQGVDPTTQATSGGELAAERQRIEGELFNRMRPEHDFQSEALETRLANQGLTPGSAAYERERQRLGDQQSRERFNALEMGGNEQARMEQMLRGREAQAFGQEMQGETFDAALRQQGIGERLQRRGMSLNEMNALLTGQMVNQPNFPGFTSAQGAQAPNLLGAATAQGQFDLNAFANKQQQWGDMASLGGAAAMYFSDLRLKSQLKRVGRLPIGVGVYEYVMFGVRQLGVLAQEVMAVRPDLVKRHASGYLMVNYGGLV